MQELIAKLEAATEGSGDLTADIYEAMGFEVKRGEHFNASRFGRCVRSVRWRYLQDGRGCRMRDYTTSLDDAVTLYPVRPKTMPTDPRLAAIEALRARQKEKPNG